ncbi:142_t:CDS:2 [Diversispora eburnea]|uniref:142_t:CDS:1 n=1 Tax=Diversispora eburnea TaxID=1213867 RepID=A0A9N8WPX2_9GLOM|nr:142_t:CDS:2 [Diversispora eburnea]
MANKISTELLITILNNVQSTQDLFSSLLVNRIWCKVTIPILWELPLGQEYRIETDIDYEKLKKKALCIRTYISLHRRFYMSCFNFNDSIGSILKLPGASKVFKELESFTSIIIKRDKPLYESLALICNNILNMELFFHCIPRMEPLTKLLSVQKRLENLSITDNNLVKQLDINSIFWAIISLKETLKSLRLISVNFYSFKRELSPIGQFTSLQKLYVENGNGFLESECLFLASSFTQLNSFHYTHSVYVKDTYPQEFIIQILETANTNLKNICLELNSTITFDIFSAILNYCTRITELTLYNLSPEQIMAIFNNNFNELRSFSFDCGRGFDSNELLCQMAENVPESLETIEIRMDCEYSWIFGAESLRKFFEGWGCCKGGGNKKFRRLCIRLIRSPLFRRPSKRFLPLTLKTMGDEHFKVIEEYGIQFDMTEYSKFY